jgi:hypothetical protein
VILSEHERETLFRAMTPMDGVVQERAVHPGRGPAEIRQDRIKERKLRRVAPVTPLDLDSWTVRRLRQLAWFADALVDGPLP